MAEAIPDDVLILPGRVLIEPDEGDDACMGTIIEVGIGDFGPFKTRIKFSYQEPGTPGNGENPPVPGEIIDYTRVVFKREGAQEVKKNGTDCILIHTDDILAFIQPE